MKLEFANGTIWQEPKNVLFFLIYFKNSVFFLKKIVNQNPAFQNHILNSGNIFEIKIPNSKKNQPDFFFYICQIIITQFLGIRGSDGHTSSIGNTHYVKPIPHT